MDYGGSSIFSSILVRLTIDSIDHFNISGPRVFFQKFATRPKELSADFSEWLASQTCLLACPQGWRCTSERTCHVSQHRNQIRPARFLGSRNTRTLPASMIESSGRAAGRVALPALLRQHGKLPWTPQFTS